MDLNRSELRNQRNSTKTPAGRYTRIAVAVFIVVTVALGLYALGGQEPAVKTASKGSVTPTNDSLARLYAEAKKDLAEGKLADAGVKFKQLTNIDAKYKDAADQAAAVAEKIYDEAVKDIEAGRFDEAKEKLETARSIDPKNKKADKKLSEIKDKTGGTTPGTSESPGPADEPAPTGETAREIPADATPETLLVGDIDGYQTTQNGWLKKPIEAGSTYIPTSVEVSTDIDRVLLTVAKLDTNQAAEERLQAEKDSFPLEKANPTVNGHQAYAGIYNFENASQFYKLRQMATLTWTRGNWFFSIQVLPKGTPTTDYKVGIAKDTAVKLSY